MVHGANGLKPNPHQCSPTRLSFGGLRERSWKAFGHPQERATSTGTFLGRSWLPGRGTSQAIRPPRRTGGILANGTDAPWPVRSQLGSGGKQHLSVCHQEPLLGVLQTRTTQPKPATPTLSTSGSPASRSKAAKNSWIRKLKGGKEIKLPHWSTPSGSGSLQNTTKNAKGFVCCDSETKHA